MDALQQFKINSKGSKRQSTTDIDALSGRFQVIF